MAIAKFLENLNIIGSLGDKPGSENGLTPAQFKEKFDEAPLKIQQYINNTLIPAIENTTPGLYSLTMDLAAVTLYPSNWVDNQQTVAVSKVVEDSSKQAIISVAESGSRETYLDCNIDMKSQGDGTLTFSCDDVPDSVVVLNIMILTKGV